MVIVPGMYINEVEAILKREFKFVELVDQGQDLILTAQLKSDELALADVLEENGIPYGVKY